MDESESDEELEDTWSNVKYPVEPTQLEDSQDPGYHPTYQDDMSETLDSEAEGIESPPSSTFPFEEVGYK